METFPERKPGVGVSVLLGMLRFQRGEGLVGKLVQLLVVLDSVGSEFATKICRNLEAERHWPRQACRLSVAIAFHSFRLWGLSPYVSGCLTWHCNRINIGIVPIFSQT